MEKFEYYCSRENKHTLNPKEWAVQTEETYIHTMLSMPGRAKYYRTALPAPFGFGVRVFSIKSWGNAGYR